MVFRWNTTDSLSEGMDMYISVCIPTWEAYGYGVQMLERCLESLEQQSFKDFEVVISDNSQDESIYNVCRDFNSLDILYDRCQKIGIGANTNNSIHQANGELVKILYQDDYLAGKDSLQEIVDNFDIFDTWLITGSSNNPQPYYSQHNTLGSPSVLTMRNNEPLLFNETLKWVLDLDYYRRMYLLHGPPKIVPGQNVIIGLGPWQETNNLTNEEKLKEQEII